MFSWYASPSGLRRAFQSASAKLNLFFSLTYTEQEGLPICSFYSCISNVKNQEGTVVIKPSAIYNTHQSTLQRYLKWRFYSREESNGFLKKFFKRHGNGFFFSSWKSYNCSLIWSWVPYFQCEPHLLATRLWKTFCLTQWDGTVCTWSTNPYHIETEFKQRSNYVQMYSHFPSYS